MMPRSLMQDSDEEEEKHEKPDFVNNQEGVAVWEKEDKNGNEFLSVSLPLDLGNVNVFPNRDKEE